MNTFQSIAGLEENFHREMSKVGARAAPGTEAASSRLPTESLRPCGPEPHAAPLPRSCGGRGGCGGEGGGVLAAQSPPLSCDRPQAAWARGAVRKCGGFPFRKQINNLLGFSVFDTLPCVSDVEPGLLYLCGPAWEGGVAHARVVTFTWFKREAEGRADGERPDSTPVPWRPRRLRGQGCWAPARRRPSRAFPVTGTMPPFLSSFPSPSGPGSEDRGPGGPAESVV